MKTNPNKAAVRNITVTDSEFAVVKSTISIIRDVENGDEYKLVIGTITNKSFDGLCHAGHDTIVRLGDTGLDPLSIKNCLQFGLEFLGAQYLEYKLKPKSAATPPASTPNDSD